MYPLLRVQTCNVVFISSVLAQPRVRSLRLHHRGGQSTGRRWPTRRQFSSSRPGARTAGDCKSFLEEMDQLERFNWLKTEPEHKTYRKESNERSQHPKKTSNISSRDPRMGAASNGTFTSTFSVTLIRHKALMIQLSSPGSSCRSNGLRPKFIGKDCAVLSPKKPRRKSGGTQDFQTRSWTGLGSRYCYLLIAIYLSIYVY